MFDGIMNRMVINLITSNKDYRGTEGTKALISLVKLGSKFGCKYIWEKPLRNKIINWIIEDLKRHSITCNEEMMKTIARVSAYVTCAAA
jgi:hypothetical protein